MKNYQAHKESYKRRKVAGEGLCLLDLDFPSVRADVSLVAI